LQAGIFGADGFVELGVALFIAAGAVKPFFVADFDVGEREGRGVTVFDTLGAPFGVGSAGDVFNLIERVLHVRFEVLAGIDVVAAQRVSGIDGEDGLHVEVFAPLEKFKQAEAVRGVVIPGAGMGGAIDHGADGLLPVVVVGDAVAFKIIAAGEAQEGGVHGGHLFHQVSAVAVGAVLVGGREERNEIEPESSGMSDGDGQVVVRGRLDGAGFELEVDLLPAGGEAVDFSAGEGFAGLVGDEADDDRTDVRGAGFGVEGALVNGIRMERHAPPAAVEHASGVFGVGVGDFDFEAGLEGVAGAGLFVDGEVGGGVAVFDQVPVEDAAPIAAKGAVADHFRIEAAVVGVVDLLSHEAVEGGADGVDGLVGVDGEFGGRLGVEQGGSEQEGGGSGVSKRFLYHADFPRKAVPGQYIAWSGREIESGFARRARR